MRARKLLGPLEEQQFRNYFFARTFSLLGDGIVPVALAFAVLEIEKSASALGLVLAAYTLPQVLFILAACRSSCRRFASRRRTACSA